MVLPAQLAHGQSTVRSQDYFRDVTALAEVLPTLQALREFLDQQRNAVDGLT